MRDDTTPPDCVNLDGFSVAERRGVERLIQRIRFDMLCRTNMSAPERALRIVALALLEAL